MPEIKPNFDVKQNETFLVDTALIFQAETSSKNDAYLNQSQ